MEISAPAKFYTESVLYDDLIDVIEVDTANKSYTLYTNLKADALDSIGEMGEFMPLERDAFDIILSAVKAQFSPSSDEK